MLVSGRVNFLFNERSYALYSWTVSYAGRCPVVIVTQLDAGVSTANQVPQIELWVSSWYIYFKIWIYTQLTSTFDLWYLWYERVKIERKHLTLPKIWLDYKNLSCVLVFFWKTIKNRLNFFTCPSHEPIWRSHGGVIFDYLSCPGVGAMILFHEFTKMRNKHTDIHIWFFPKIGVPPNHPFL